MQQNFTNIRPDAPTLEQKVRFLSTPAAYRDSSAGIVCRETDMSCVFLAGDHVYKLKKPVRFPYLDFSTLTRREAACRAELTLNRRLAPDVYLALLPLNLTSDGLCIGGDGAVVDWLIVMRRLDESLTLEHSILSGRIEQRQLDQLVAALTCFYRTATRPFMPALVHLADWSRRLSDNRRVLLDARLGLPTGLVRKIDYVQRNFLLSHKDLLLNRVRGRNIVDGHGDLRPEHIWLGTTVRIIDRLEFNPRLRMVDPFDEIAFLSLECERLGANWAGGYIKRRMARALCDGLSEELFLFYRCYRATVRARLAIAHMLEPTPRTPEKWPHTARAYLRIAVADARRLEHILRKPTGPRAIASFRAA